MSMIINNAQDILNILEPIPEDMFITGTLFEPFNKASGKCCALGHINKAVNGDPSIRVRSVPVLTNKYLNDVHGIDCMLADINNEPIYNGYTEPVIKDRVIHLLKDMIRDGY